MNCITPTSKFTLIDFPEIRQAKAYTCGVASLQAILYYYGLSYREDQLEKMLYATPEKGTNPPKIIQLCRSLGLKVTTHHNMNFDMVKSYLDQKKPILVAYQAWNPKKTSYAQSWLNGHYSVIVGLIDENVILEDPSLIGLGYITKDDFLTRWHDKDSDGNKYIRYGMVIYGRDVAYNSNLICPID